jgi:hypothetical protein
MALTDQQYYQNSTNWGGYQYVTLADIINNFYLFYVGDNKVINEVDRYDIIFHAKRGLQELHYDALKDVRALELDLPDDLQLELPKDFVSLVRLSWVDERGRFHPMIVNNDSAIVTAYLQDNNYNILFDENGEALQADSVTDINIAEADSDNDTYDALFEYNPGARFGMETSRANINGTYRIDKRLGVIRFSSDVFGKTIVIEYVTDGLNDLTEADIKVNKLAEDYLYKHIANQILNHKFGVQEYIVRRVKNEAFAALKNLKIRMMDVHPMDLVQAGRGRDKWIK